MADPIIIGGVVIVAGALAYIFWPSTASAADKAAADKKLMDAACAAGTLDGTNHGTADKGKAHDPRPLINYSDIKTVQQQYENCYNDGYEKTWVAPSPAVVVDSTPSSGGKSKTMSAYDYGCSRGTSSGRAAGEAGDDSTWGANLETDGSRKRQAESGDPAQYRLGYQKCYIAAYATAYAARSTLGDEEGKLGKGGFSGRGKRGGAAIGGMYWREPYKPAFVRAA